MSFQRNLLSFQRYLLSEVKKVNTDVFYWGFPLAVGFGWFIWDAIDEEFLVSYHLAADPELPNRRVEAARLARLEALKQKPALSTPVAAGKEAPVDEPEEEEAEEEEVEEEEAPVEEKEVPPTEEEEAAAEDEAPVEEEDVPAGEDGEDDAAEEEEDEGEESEVVIKPLYDPVKGKKLGKKDIWDNFTIKALNMGEDDDDDEEEEEEEEEGAGTLNSHFVLFNCDLHLTRFDYHFGFRKKNRPLKYVLPISLFFINIISWNEI